MGGLIMSHSDDKGLVLPPAVAPLHVVIVPFFKSPEDLAVIEDYIAPLQEELNQSEFMINLSTKQVTREIALKFDDDDGKSAGWKFNEYELQGVPVRLTIGKKEIEKGLIEMYRRDT